MPINPATGKREFKNQGHMPDKNYAADIVNSPDRWRYVQGGALEKYLTGYKTEDVNPYKQLGKDQSIIPYKGGIAPWSELNVKPDENNKLKERDHPEVRLKTEDDYITENGQRIPIKVLNKQVYKQVIEDIPENNDDLTRMWEDYKEKNNIKSKNTVEDEKRKRAFAVGVFQQHDPSEIHGLVPQHLPRNTTNLYIGKDKEDTHVNDLYKRVFDRATEAFDAHKPYLQVNLLDADAQAMVIDYAKKLTGFNDLGQEEVKVFKHGDKVALRWARNSRGIENNRFIGYLDPVGVNIKAQPGIKEKREVLKEGEKTQQKTSKKNDPLGLF
jgi:hypothetical protein